MKTLDIWAIRNKVFDLFGLGEVNEPTYKTLIKAHLVFLHGKDAKQFETMVRDLR